MRRGAAFRLDMPLGESDPPLFGRLVGGAGVVQAGVVLGIVSASIELYMELGYKDGYAIGRASLTISIEIGFFETSVTIRCEKRFAGSGAAFALAGGTAAPGIAPPTFSDLMSPYVDPVTGTRVDPVFDYCTAFAEVA